MRIVEQIQPYAGEFQAIINQLGDDGSKTAVNMILETLFPELTEFRKSDEARKDKLRLQNKKP